MKEPKYNIGDYIKTYSNLTGTIAGFKYDDVSKEWLYRIENISFITKESNIREDVLSSPDNSSDNKNGVKSSRRSRK